MSGAGRQWCRPGKGYSGMKKLLMLMLVLTAVPAYAGDTRAPWKVYGLNGAPSQQQHRDDHHDHHGDDPYKRQHERWNSGNGDFRYSGNQLEPQNKNRATTTTCVQSVCITQQ
jgi:hypothetical protein